MAFPRKKWKTKADALRSARKTHCCTACLHSQPVTFDKCPACGVDGMRVYFPSREEHLRAATLIRMFKEGIITHLRFHPRYNLIVEGQKICAYEADAEYRRDGKLVVEDTKPPNTDFMDKTASMKISLFNALHSKLGVAVTIYRSS